MIDFFHRRSTKTGQPPGTLTHVGHRKVESVVIRMVQYNESQVVERQEQTVSECLDLNEDIF